jgi:hypothetical protein
MTKKRSPSLSSCHDPFASSFEELVQQQAEVGQDESANVKAKELSGVPGAELQADLSLVRKPQTGVVDLPCNLICIIVSLPSL